MRRIHGRPCDDDLTVPNVDLPSTDAYKMIRSLPLDPHIADLSVWQLLEPARNLPTLQGMSAKGKLRFIWGRTDVAGVLTSHLMDWLCGQERLAMAEQALRELPVEGLVVLLADVKAESPIPRDQHDEYLRSWDTWIVTERGPKASSGPPTREPSSIRR